MHTESGFQIAPNWQWRHKFWTWRQFFWRYFFSFVKLSYWCKFHVNIITGSGVITIPFYKRLTRNLVIGHTPVWVLHNIWRLWQVRNAKFCTNVSNKALSNASKCQCYSFYRFWVIKGKPTDEIWVKAFEIKSSTIFNLVLDSNTNLS